MTDGIRLDKVRKKENLFIYAEKFKPDMILNRSHLYPELCSCSGSDFPALCSQELSPSRIVTLGYFHKSWSI